MASNIKTSISNVNRCIYLTCDNSTYSLLNMDYGDRLRLARKHAKLTQDALAEAAELKQPSISYLEDTSNGCTGSEFTARFARICGISVDWLADEIGEMLPDYYQTTDPKIIAVARVMEPMPDYGKDAAVKDVSE